jgi:hypothetical protein
MVAGKDWSLGDSPRVTIAARGRSSLSEHDFSHANQEIGAAVGKTEKNSLGARRGGAARCYDRGYCESESVPGSAHE